MLDDDELAWFKLLEFESDGRTVTVSAPVKFVRNWYGNISPTTFCRAVAPRGAERVDMVWRWRGRRPTLIA